jgi:spermidine synthase
MKRPLLLAGLAGLIFARTGAPVRAAVVFETTSPYHHIQVIDRGDIRTLSFDGTSETCMSLTDPLKGHFEYTEFFHMPWLWNTQITNVLMIGLGGASTQRAYQHDYPQVQVTTAEIDAMVFKTATNFFTYRETTNSHVLIGDGRLQLRRSQTVYDLIILDAYIENRYGSFIPYHLATREFFNLATNHLGTNGVLAFNVIGQLAGFQADIMGSVYKTMKAVFPQVYLFPARESQNVVLIGTRSGQPVDAATLQQRASLLLASGRIKLPAFRTRLQSFRSAAPANFSQSQVLTDDFAPVDGMLSHGR